MTAAVLIVLTNSKYQRELFLSLIDPIRMPVTSYEYFVLQPVTRVRYPKGLNTIKKYCDVSVLLVGLRNNANTNVTDRI